MDAPGFPPDPSLWSVLLLWLVPSAIAVAALVVAVAASRRRQLDNLRWVLSIVSVVVFLVPALFLFVPTSWHEADGAVLECPLSGAAGSVMPGDHDSELYRFWEPCVAASRVRVGVSTGAYAVAAGAIGLIVLRAPKRSWAESPSQRSASRT
ncbi:hypothetical protein GCM10009593_38660 [Microlunatus antarcticus]|uniref:Uncharacterized protein n=1 Tax=Microlunatus antarcticus TaxID=53388 RepID=A0A7W5P6B5_9ACTN|nr:hypothetical protein [Microlunatus antarcticus]